MVVLVDACLARSRLHVSEHDTVVVVTKWKRASVGLSTRRNGARNTAQLCVGTRERVLIDDVAF
jgi:hypothetical protein